MERDDIEGRPIEVTRTKRHDDGIASAVKSAILLGIFFESAESGPGAACIKRVLLGSFSYFL